MKRKLVMIELEDEFYDKLEQYDFDWNRNCKQWCKIVAKEIIQCEKETKEEDL